MKASFLFILNTKEDSSINWHNLSRQTLLTRLIISIKKAQLNWAFLI